MPVPFHVDYWDYLGWKDPFAAKAYTQRQHDYATQWRSHSVYTLGLVLDGKEWRGWFNRNELPRASNKSIGALTAISEDGKQWRLRFEPAARGPTSSFDFHAVLLGFDLSSDVKAGENRGRNLQHDFVVMRWPRPLRAGAATVFRESCRCLLRPVSRRKASPSRHGSTRPMVNSRSRQLGAACL